MLHFSTQMEFGKNLTFQWNKSGNVDKSFDGTTGTFTAPISGRYSFGLFMTVQNGPRGYYYRLRMNRSGSAQSFPETKFFRTAQIINHKKRHS